MALTLTRNDNGQSITINNITQIEYTLGRFVDSVPMIGNDSSQDPDNGALVYDLGGLRIVYNITFEEAVGDMDAVKQRFQEIDGFFAGITVLTGVLITLDEIGLENRQGVVREVRLTIKGGEVGIIHGNIQLLGGKII